MELLYRHTMASSISAGTVVSALPLVRRHVDAKNHRLLRRWDMGLKSS